MASVVLPLAVGPKIVISEELGVRSEELLTPSALLVPLRQEDNI